MTWSEIAAFPTTWDPQEGRGDRCHESMVRSYHVANEVRRLLELGTPPSVVLQVMDLLEGRSGKEG